MSETSKMTVTEALQLIVDNAANPALNYAINYAKYGLSITNPEELRVQCLYVLNNIGGWRANKKFAVTKEEIVEARTAIKKAAGVK